MEVEQGQGITFTVFGAARPLVKHVSLDEGGKLVKKAPISQVTTARKIVAPTLQAVIATLEGLKDNEAAGWGVYASTQSILQVVLAERYAIGDAGELAIARTKECFMWSNGPGVFMADIDEDHDPDEARMHLIQAARTMYGRDVLGDVEMCYRPSSSAGIYAGAEELRSGGRLYFVVEKAGDIPALGRDLADGLWINGQGFVKPSASGTPLYRTLVDEAVWSPERIDYTGPATLGEGVSRRHIAPRVWGIPGCAAALPPDGSSKNALAERARRTALAEAQDGLTRVRRSWVDARVKKSLEELIAQGMKPEDAKGLEGEVRQTFVAASEAQTLTPKIVLYLDAAMSRSITVAQIMADPSTYHGMKCCDPTEPEGTFGKAIIYTHGRQVVHSFLHGSTVYRIAAQERLLVPPFVAGDKPAIVKSITRAVAGAFPNQLFIRHGVPVYVTGDGRLRALDARGLILHLDKGIQFQLAKVTKKGVVMSPTSLSTETAEDFIKACGDAYTYDVDQPEIVRVVNRPILLPDTNRVVIDPGYDPASKMYLSLDGEFPPLPEVRNLTHARELMNGLLRPYSGFTLNAEGGARSALLAAGLLSVTSRSTIAAPSLLITASRAGSGKTELSRCYVAEKGEDMRSTSYSQSEEECRKIVVAQFQTGRDYLVIENYDHVIPGSPLEELTDKDVCDPCGIRQLGSNTEVLIYNDRLIIINGNNARAGGLAMARRLLEILLVAVDPPPWAGREFEFGNPVEYIKSNWRVRHVTCLALLRWFKAHWTWPEGQTPPRFNSYHNFDSYVRQLVLALYDFDVAGHITSEAEEIVKQSAETSPDGRLYTYAWKMCQSYLVMKDCDSGWEGAMDGSGAIPIRMPDASNGFVEPETVDSSGVLFTMRQLKEFIFFNQLDVKNGLDPLYRRAKKLSSGGVVHGMSWVSTGRMDRKNTAMWRILGRPVEV